MNTATNFYVKNRIRMTCYQYHYYLVRYEVSKDELSIKITTRDKTDKFNRMIEKEYPTKDILKLLSIYLKELIFHIKFLDPVENISGEEYEKIAQARSLLIN